MQKIKLLFCVLVGSMLLCSSLSAQVFNTAQTLKKGTFSFGLNPSMYVRGSHSDLGIFLHGGCGIKSGMDMDVKVGLGYGETYYGADIEWAISKSNPYFSITTGAHVFHDFVLDGVANLTFAINKQTRFYTGIDVDVVFAKDVNFPLWLPLGVAVALNKNVDFIFETEIALNNKADHVVGGGFSFYF